MFKRHFYGVFWTPSQSSDHLVRIQGRIGSQRKEVHSSLELQVQGMEACRHFSALKEGAVFVLRPPGSQQTLMKRRRCAASAVRRHESYQNAASVFAC